MLGEKMINRAAWWVVLTAKMGCFAPSYAIETGEPSMRASKNIAACHMPAVCRSVLLDSARPANEQTLGQTNDCSKNDPVSMSLPYCNPDYRRYRICALYMRQPELFRNKHCKEDAAPP